MSAGKVNHTRLIRSGRHCAVLLLLSALLSCGGGESNSAGSPGPAVTPPPPAPTVPTSESVNFETVVSGYQIPWAIEVINQDEFLFTERLGVVYYVKNGTVIELRNAPQTRTVTVAGLVYGGMMDISLHPEFDDNRMVYLAYVGGDQRMSVARFRLDDTTMANFEVIFHSNAFSIGSRIAWQDNDHFFVTQGVGGNPFPEPGPQDLRHNGGKIHRLHQDGSIPQDNPVFDEIGVPSSVWSYGHRDPQGLFYDQQSQTLYSNEHGPLGGDELNVIEKGMNYGWPLFSYGLNYDQSVVSTLSQAEAAESTVLPIKFWHAEDTIAPSSLRILRDSLFSEWNGWHLMGSLVRQGLVGYHPDTNSTENLLVGIGRVRDVAQMPDGTLLIAVDRESPGPGDTGRIIRLSPK